MLEFKLEEDAPLAEWWTVYQIYPKTHPEKSVLLGYIVTGKKEGIWIDQVWSTVSYSNLDFQECEQLDEKIIELQDKLFLDRQPLLTIDQDLVLDCVLNRELVGQNEISLETICTR